MTVAENRIHPWSIQYAALELNTKALLACIHEFHVSSHLPTVRLRFKSYRPYCLDIHFRWENESPRISRGKRKLRRRGPFLCLVHVTACVHCAREFADSGVVRMPGKLFIVLPGMHSPPFPGLTSLYLSLSVSGVRSPFTRLDI